MLSITSGRKRFYIWNNQMFTHIHKYVLYYCAKQMESSETLHAIDRVITYNLLYNVTNIHRKKYATRGFYVKCSYMNSTDHWQPAMAEWYWPRYWPIPATTGQVAKLTSYRNHNQSNLCLGLVIKVLLTSLLTWRVYVSRDANRSSDCVLCRPLDLHGP